MKRFDCKGTLKTQIEAIRSIIGDKDNNWYKLIMSLWTDINKGVRNKLFENFIINGCLLGFQRQKNFNCQRAKKELEYTARPIEETLADVYMW